MRRVAAEGGGDMPAVPITVRQLEAITRIAESLARMTLQEEATEDHVREAIRLFKHSTMDAVKSGAGARFHTSSYCLRFHDIRQKKRHCAKCV